MNRSRPIRCLRATMLLLIVQGTLFAEGILALYPSFTPLHESAAYQQFRNRPVSELSKLIYLIDRFGASDIEVLYDGHYFSAVFSARVARWFLSRHYRRENTEQWIMRWCNTTVPAGNLIWVKLPDGKFALAREILLQELKDLELAISQEKTPAVFSPP